MTAGKLYGRVRGKSPFAPRKNNPKTKERKRTHMKTKQSRKLSDASDLIEAMLKENTGTHFMDSGGSSGRAWQRNQTRDFAKEPQVELEVNEWTDSEGKEHLEPSFSVSTYHYLCAFLALNDVCKRFNKIPCKDWDSDLAYGVSKKGEEFLSRIGAEVKEAVNTYNYDCPLDQVLQFSPVEIDGEDYVLLQVHGGADVRGGYTDAKLFTFKHYAEPQAFGSVDVYGTINGRSVSNTHKGGTSLNYDDDNGATSEDIKVLGKGKDEAFLEIMGI